MSNAKINKQTVKKMALLARISKDLSDKELNEYAEKLDSVLSYVQELQEIDVSGVEATDIIPTCTIDDLREDEACKDQDSYQRVRQNIISNFPKKQGDLLVLPVKVVE